MNPSVAAIATAAALALSVLTILTSAPVFAQISPADTGCENPAGNAPAGQQPTCQGGGLTQFFENQNPAGKAPPGQN